MFNIKLEEKADKMSFKTLPVKIQWSKNQEPTLLISYFQIETLSREQLHVLLMMLLLILMELKHFYLVVCIHCSIKAIQFLVMVLRKILLIVLFYGIEFWIILLQSYKINVLYQLVTTYVESFCHHQLHKYRFFVHSFNLLCIGFEDFTFKVVHSIILY